VLDYLGIGATAGALHPLDVLVAGCQDCVQLQVDKSGFILVYTSTITLFSFIFQPTKYSRR
jgi:hypothetical protein